MAKRRITQTICSIEGCERKYWARQMCAVHYSKWRAEGKPDGFEPTRKIPLFGTGETEADQFWSRVDKSAGQGPNGECWEWQGGRSRYGNLHYQGNVWGSHRLAYYLHYGVHPQELRVLHKCDNPPCCNPNHLFLGTDQDNVRDKFAKGRGGQGDTHWTRHKPERIARGEKQHSAKMTAEKVVAMRRLWDAGGITSGELGKMFGIRQSSAYKICSRQSWKHIE